MGRKQNKGKPQKRRRTKRKAQDKKKTPGDSNIFKIKKLSNQKSIEAVYPFINTKGRARAMSIPVFRRDMQSDTPAFCLPDQFTKQFEREQKQLHEQRVYSEIAEIDVNDIKQPRPSQRSSYCTICKARFEDYKEHIKQQYHMTKMNGSGYNILIKEFCLMESKNCRPLESCETQKEQRLYNSVKGEAQVFKLSLPMHEDSVMAMFNPREDKK